MSGNYLGSPLATSNQDLASGRIDHRLSDSSQLTLRYSYGQQYLVEPYAENQSELPGFGDVVNNQGQNVLLRYQKTFGARVNNSLTLGFNREIRQIFGQNHNTDVNTLWGVDYLPTQPRDYGYPAFQ